MLLCVGGGISDGTCGLGRAGTGGRMGVEMWAWCSGGYMVKRLGRGCTEEGD